MSRGQVFSQHPLQYEFQSSAIVLPILSFFYRADACVFFTHWRIRQSVSRQQNHSRILICRKIVSISIGALPDSSMGMPEVALPCGSVGGSFAWDPRIRSSSQTFDPTKAEMVGYRRRARTQTAIRTIRDPRSGKVPGTDPRKSVEEATGKKIKSLIKEGRGAW